MAIGFIIWSITAVIFGGIGISCRKSHEAAGFFTFVKPPTVENTEQYNRAVSTLWLVAAAALEIIGIPLLFVEQNSPIAVIIVPAVIVLVIGMMAAYFRIEAKYRKQK